MLEWRDGGSVPPVGVIGGRDLNGEPLYVGRFSHGGDHIPGKINLSHGCCYVSYAGEEHSNRTYEYLVKPSYGTLRWISAHNGDVPYGAVVGGRTAGGETLYIGRAIHGESLVIGKVHGSHGVLYMPFDGKEISRRAYEVLCITD